MIEYKVVKARTRNQELEGVLNEMTKEGWTPLEFLPLQGYEHSNWFAVIFTRPLRYSDRPLG
jgi:hypothetical protein